MPTESARPHLITLVFCSVRLLPGGLASGRPVRPGVPIGHGRSPGSAGSQDVVHYRAVDNWHTMTACRDLHRSLVPTEQGVDFQVVLQQIPVTWGSVRVRCTALWALQCCKLPDMLWKISDRGHWRKPRPVHQGPSQQVRRHRVSGVQEARNATAEANVALDHRQHQRIRGAR